MPRRVRSPEEAPCPGCLGRSPVRAKHAAPAGAALASGTEPYGPTCPAPWSVRPGLSAGGHGEEGVTGRAKVRGVEWVRAGKGQAGAGL